MGMVGMVDAAGVESGLGESGRAECIGRAEWGSCGAMLISG